MTKNKSNILVIAVATLAVCMSAIVITLIVKSNSGVGADEVTDKRGDSYADSYETVTAAVNTPTAIGDSGFSLTSMYTPEITTVLPATSGVSAPAATTKAPAEQTTQPNQLDETEHAGAGSGKGVASTNAALPKDMSFAGLSTMGYNVIGGKAYIYNNDKNEKSVQKKFGYNKLYDTFAGIADFTIETVRLQFAYEGQDWMIQLWKGQYISGDIGTVGGEVGVYTRPEGTVSAIGHYSCAEEEDWLNLETTCFWDEKLDGNYLPQYTRNYTKYWWATGYVDGQLSNKNNNNELRLLTRITFKTPEMAQAFEQALISRGFKEVSTFNPTVIETYKISGSDVIFLWQNARG